MDFFRRRVSVDAPVFVDLTSDYGFKAIFGNELNKDVLLALLRQLVTDEKIAEIKYIDKERRMLRRDAKSCAFELRAPMFQRLYEASRFAAMGAVEQYKYIRNMTTKADIKAQMDYKYEQGLEKGVEKGKMDEKNGIAKNLISLGIADEVIAKSTGLMVEQIEEMK